MALITWDDTLSVNIKKIDEQHKKLIGLLNSLYDAMLTGKSKETLGTVLNELVNYTVYHFTTEEEYMLKYDFPADKYEFHVKEHNEFKAKAADLVSRFETSSAILSLEVFNYLRDWVKNHVMDTDKQYQDFLNQQGVF
ncbi:MAG: hemerythrin family protein [Ignavibacteriaceae bacterium]|nr:hemerythrin family protein [Ignavibacteriaceae bacterium]